MKRKGGRPEMKQIQLVVAETSLPASATQVVPCTPQTIALGDNYNQRQGNRIKYLRVSIMFWFWNDMSPGSSNELSRMRVSIISPKVDDAHFTSYLATFGNQTFWDHNIVHVYYDKPLLFSNLASAVNSYGSGTLSGIAKRISIKFPRQVQFRQGSNDVVDAADKMYISFANLNTVTVGSPSVYAFTSKVSYIDY